MAGSGVRNLRLWKAAESKNDGYNSGVRHLRLAESEFYGVAGSGQWSQKFTDSGVRSLRLRGRHRSQKFTESGVINLRLCQAAESEIYGCDRQRRQIFTGSGVRNFTDSGVRSLRLWQAVKSEVYG